MSNINSTQSTWSNWSGTVTSKTHQIVVPSSDEEVVDVVVKAILHGHKIRVVGSGHSFSPLCETNGILVSLDNYRGIISIDRANRKFVVRAGTKLSDVGESLYREGLALKNQGDIDVQTFGGLISTGTHGTGLSLSNMTSSISSMRIATSEGKIETLTREKNESLFNSALVSLGMLGIILDVTIDLIPKYLLEESNWLMKPSDCFSQLNTLHKAHRNLEVLWLPQFDKCVVKALNTVFGRGVSPDGIMNQDLAPPGTIERYLIDNRIHWSHRIYPSKRTVPFNEMEFAVPFESGLACFKDIRNLVLKRFPDCVWDVQCRTLSADAAYLSQGYKRDSVCISIHEGATRSFEKFFRASQEIFLHYNGRPHWGKIHYCDHNLLRDLYPCWNEFLSIRNRMDPEKIFLNDHLETVFGIE